MRERRGVATRRRGGALSWRNESGKSSIRGLFALAILVAGVYAGMKFIPVQASAFQFDDAVRDEVIFAGGRRASDDAIRRNLLERASILGLKVTSGDIRIIRTGGNKYITIEVDYSVTIEFVGDYTYERKFSPSHTGPLIF